MLRAWCLANGVEVECNSLKERLLLDYFQRERTVKLLEHLLLVNAIVTSSSKFETNNKLPHYIKLYEQALWPERKLQEQMFDEKGKKVLSEFAGKIFEIGFKNRGMSGKIRSIEDLQKEKAQDANS